MRIKCQINVYLKIVLLGQVPYEKPFMLWRPFFARVKVNHRKLYCRILAKMCAVAMATGLVNDKV